MQLTADQELRRELLLFSLSKQPDLGAALCIAAQMERFVLKGDQIEDAAGRGAATTKANGAGHLAARTEAEHPKVSHDLSCSKMNGDAAALARPNGGSSSARPAIDVRDASSGSKKRRWSKGDDDRLRKLWHSDHSLEEIAEAMGRTTPSLYSRARALGMSKRSPVVDKREPGRPAHGGREPASAGAAPAPAGEDDTPGEARKPPDPVASETRSADLEVKRHRTPPSGNGKSAARGGSVLGGARETKQGGLSASHAFQNGLLDAGVEPIIHFLRSRDYSVVRVDNGRFRLDGRRVLNADELREKANQVRQSLGKPPFASQSAGSAG